MDVTTNLLGSIPVGEEIRDPKEGDHPDAELAHVESIDDKALKLIFSNLMATDGRSFEHSERVTIPNSNSEDFIHRIFLAWCHDLEIVPRSFKNRILADAPENVGQIVDAFSSRVGTNVPLRIVSGKTGYLQARVIRAKKSK